MLPLLGVSPDALVCCTVDLDDALVCCTVASDDALNIAIVVGELSRLVVVVEGKDGIVGGSLAALVTITSFLLVAFTACTAKGAWM